MANTKGHHGKDRDKGKGGKGNKPSNQPPPNPYDELSSEDRNAYEELVARFADFGLASLAPIILDLVTKDFSPSVITVKLRDTQQYKDRFKGNTTRIANGLPPLREDVYVQQESQYKEVMAYYGMPTGFYDSPDDFADWIGKGISPMEIKDRVAMAADIVTSGPQENRDMLQQYFGLSDGDMIAFALDETRAMPVLERNIRSAQIGGAAKMQGINVGAQRADELAGYGIDQERAQAGFAAVGQSLEDLRKLAKIDGSDFTQRDAEDAFVLGQQEAAEKVKTLASQERARFSGSSGVGRDSLSSNRRRGTY